MKNKNQKLCYIDRGWYYGGSEYWYIDPITKKLSDRTWNREEGCMDAAKIKGYNLFKKPPKGFY